MGLSTVFYNTGIILYRAIVGLAASIGGNQKAKLWIEGRKEVWEGLSGALAGDRPVIWMHAASLGEFEQGRPVLEALRQQYPGYRILLTFFSPSGYEVRKDYKGADHVCYLPLDTASNARRFLDIVRPSLAVFVKYEFWYHFLTGLFTRKTPVLLVSGIFRQGQAFFRPYGSMFRSLLQGMTHIFVQNEVSGILLQNIGIQQFTRSGDTRFDRVWALQQQPVSLPSIAQFITGAKVLVAGSTWPVDEAMLAAWWKASRQDYQLIIAPHETGEDRLAGIEALFPEAVRYSALKPGKVLIIDNVGMLSALYRYGRVAYVGGGFGKEGIHNLLEPATYGRPVLIGPVFHQFHEAVQLVELKGALVVNDAAAFAMQMEMLENDAYYNATANIAGRFVETNKGATEKVMAYIRDQRLLGETFLHDI